jgi:hypothetical protein
MSENQKTIPTTQEERREYVIDQLAKHAADSPFTGVQDAIDDLRNTTANLTTLAHIIFLEEVIKELQSDLDELYRAHEKRIETVEFCSECPFIVADNMGGLTEYEYTCNLDSKKLDPHEVKNCALPELCPLKTSGIIITLKDDVRQ